MDPHSSACCKQAAAVAVAAPARRVADFPRLMPTANEMAHWRRTAAATGRCVAVSATKEMMQPYLVYLHAISLAGHHAPLWCAPRSWVVGRPTTRGDQGHLMLRERVAPQFEVIRIKILEDSPCCEVPLVGSPRAVSCAMPCGGCAGACWSSSRTAPRSHCCSSPLHPVGGAPALNPLPCATVSHLLWSKSSRESHGSRARFVGLDQPH